MKKTKEFPLTPRLRLLLDTLLELDKAKEIVVKPCGFLWWKKVDTTVIKEMVEICARAKRNFWDEVYKEHPEIKPGSDASANRGCITLELAEEDIAPPTSPTPVGETAAVSEEKK